MAAKAKGGLNKNLSYIPGPPKKSRQGMGNGTKYAATSRNKARKPYRGQGKQSKYFQITTKLTMADADPKSAPNSEPVIGGETKTFGYNVAEEASKPPTPKANPNSPLAAG